MKKIIYIITLILLSFATKAQVIDTIPVVVKIGNKLNVSDTASMLSPYVRTVDLPPAGTGTVTSLATGYGLSGGTITTTGTIVVDSAALSLKYVRVSDTSVMLSPYLTNTNTRTIQNKRWIPRVDSVTSSATPSINTDNVDIFKITAQSANITSFTTNLTGTPFGGEILEIQITGTAARTISWGSSFASTTVTLPSTTVTTATLTVILQYYKSSSYGNNKWLCVNYY